MPPPPPKGGAYNQAIQKAGAAKGVLPVRVEIPREGAALTFTTALVRPGHRADATFWYLSRRLRRPLKNLLLVLAFLGSGLMVASLRGISNQGIGPGRAATLAAMALLVAAIWVGAQADLRIVLWGGFTPVILYLLYLAVRREPDRL